MTKQIDEQDHTKRYPCGNKKKYTTCRGKKHEISFDKLPNKTQKLLRELCIKRNIAETYHKRYFGNTPPIISAIFNGKRICSIGKALVCCDDPLYDWETPLDFLLSYLKTRLSNVWFTKEMEKPKRDQHEIIRWYLEGRASINQKSNLKWNAPNGKALALLHLAYDLYVLDNQNNLSERLVNRLKIKKNFNGARYEAFVFATLVRAGFKIEYTDEISGKDGKVVDCRAKHIALGEYISVEAKTRNVKNVLGAQEGNPTKIKLYSNLQKAIKKNVDEPYVLFIDLNLPDFNVKNDQIRKKIQTAHKQLEEIYKDQLPNLICYTNIPFHYSRNSTLSNQPAFGFIIFKNPKFRLKNQSIIMAIKKSIDKYAFLPKEFNEAENFTNKTQE